MADPTIEVSGLQLSNNTFSASPPGSLSVALNVVMPQKGVVEPVRGQARAFTMPTAAALALALVEFNGVLLASTAASKTSTSYDLCHADAEPVTAYGGGPYNPVDDTGLSTSYGRLKFGFGGSYLYFCTTSGPKALETIASTPRSAGLLRSGDVTPSMVSNTISVATQRWLPYGSSAAYRTIIRRPTNDGVSLLSPPSGRGLVSNSIVIAPGEMVRSGGVLVTVTSASISTSGLTTGDTFTIAPGEADFPAGSYTVASHPAANRITFASAGANVSNTLTQNFDTGPRATSVLATLSADAVAGDFIRIYRSLYTSAVAIQPSDEMFLIAEIKLAAGDITAGYVVYFDGTPQSVLTDPLYTNPQTGEGAQQANYAPPLFRDLAWWGARMWYANTTALQTLKIQMLGVGAPDGIQNNDTITFAIPGASGTPYTFTFKTSPGASDVQIFSDSVPSVNIARTAQQLVLVVNLKMVADAVPFRAYYNSAQNEAPGKILFQATSYAQAAFGVKVSRSLTWVPAMDNTTSTTSDNGRVPNGLQYSKLEQSEAVPPVNFTTVGSKNYPLARILPLQQSLLCFKQGDGIYSLTGQSVFQVLQISTANLLAIDCCAVFADSAWAYTDQGILRISDSGGATVVSRQIETELNRLRDLYPSETRDYSFAVAYEVERRIMFFVPFSIEPLSGRPVLCAFCYNNATQAWTGPVYSSVFAGYVKPSDTKLALGIYDYEWATSRITNERKGQVPAYANYANASFTVTITAAGGTNPLLVTLASLNDVEVGDGLLQGGFQTKIAAFRPDISAATVEVFEDFPWLVSTATIVKGLDCEVQFQPMGSPSSRKTLTRLAWVFKPEWFETYTGLSTVQTDQIQAELEIETPFVGFGLSSFGTAPFGDPTPLVVDVNPIDAKWTNAAEFFPGFKFHEVWPKFKLQGFVPLLETQGAPAGRGK